MIDTHPNPALLRKTVAEQNTEVLSPSSRYWPAYMLCDWSLERAGRVKLPPFTSPASLHCMSTRSPVPEPDTEDLEEDDEEKIQSAGLIIIGDEILNGFANDVNVQVTSKALLSVDIPLKSVSIIGDEVNEIASEVLRFSQKYDIVITSGGIGPTHDDVTIKGIAKALKQEIHVNREMLQHLEDLQIVENSTSTDRSVNMKTVSIVSHDGVTSLESGPPSNNCDEIGRKQSFVIDETMESFALLPKESKLLFPPSPDDYYYTSPSSSGRTQQKAVLTSGDDSVKATVDLVSPQKHKSWPILQCDNVFILPGIPKIFAEKMSLLIKYHLKSHFSTEGSQKKKLKEIRKVVLNIEEKNLLSILNGLVAKYSEQFPTTHKNYVKFGSYPFIDHPEYKTIITIESYNINSLDDATSELIRLLPHRSVLRVEKIGVTVPQFSSTADLESIPVNSDR
jgi:molybdenum cofactor synthesis domain-containing protein